MNAKNAAAPVGNFIPVTKECCNYRWLGIKLVTLPYTSKWNPVEHKAFPHITRALQGVVLTSHQLTKELIETATTKSGLKIFASILNRVYETGRKVVEGFQRLHANCF